MSNKN